MKHLLTAALLSSALAASAEAATVTYSTDVTVSSSVRHPGNGSGENAFPEKLTLPKFDPALGRLYDASFALTSDFRAQANWANPSTNLWFFGFYIEYIPGGAFSLDTSFWVSPPPYQFFFYKEVPPGESGTFDSGIIDLGASYFPTGMLFPDDLKPFIGVGNFDAAVYNHQGGVISECLPYRYPVDPINFFCGDATTSMTAHHKASITYYYALPEPDNWALMLSGLGIVGAALRVANKGGRQASIRYLTVLEGC